MSPFGRYRGKGAKEETGKRPPTSVQVRRQEVSIARERVTKQLVIVPNISFFPETAVRWAGTILVVILILVVVITNIARFPVVGCLRDMRLDVLLSLFLFRLALDREGVVQIMFSLRIVRFRFVWIESFSNLFLLTLLRIGMSGKISD